MTEPTDTQKTHDEGGVASHAFFSGWYWWKSEPTDPPQIVEVFFQDGKWLVARHGRSMCVSLDERGGMFMAMIVHPSVSGYLKGIVLNSLGRALAGIESLHAWADSRIGKHRKLSDHHLPSIANNHGLAPIAFVDWIRANGVLSYRRFRPLLRGECPGSSWFYQENAEPIHGEKDA